MVKIDLKSRIPKYKQIIKSIQGSIKNKDLKPGDQLPSINSLCENLGIARDTVIKAYKELTTTGIVSSMPGKGYYVAKDHFGINHHIFLLFDLFMPYKKAIYNSFVEKMGKNSVVDIFFHHYNPDLYKKLILEAKGQYTDYVIMPLEGDERYSEWLDMVFDNESVYILDLGIKLYGNKYPSVCQNFEKEWNASLCKLKEKIQKYDKFILTPYKGAFSEYTRTHDNEMENGFLKFCNENDINYEIVNDNEKFEIKNNECYMIPDDKELVRIVKEARKKGFRFGEDIGAISHPESPMKSIICLDGITTISTDYSIMGEKLADMIKNGKKEHLESEYFVNMRNSL